MKPCGRVPVFSRCARRLPKAFGLASNLGIEQKAARDYIDRYFARFAGVKRYMDETKARWPLNARCRCARRSGRFCQGSKRVTPTEPRSASVSELEGVHPMAIRHP